MAIEGVPFKMGPLAPNPKYVPPKDEIEPAKKKVVRRRKTASTTTAKKSAQTSVPARTPRPLPASSAQPRDHLGRFASKAGALLWGATKATAVGTARAVVGTVKAGKKVHKGVKTYQKQQKRRQNLEMRERNVTVTQQEIQLGIRSPKRKKKVIRRKR
jgi:hypothetical protein